MEKNKKTKSKNVKIRYIIAFVVIFTLVFLSSFYKNNGKVASYVVEAQDISETMLMMKEKSTINMALEYEKQLIEAEEERLAKLEEERKQEELEQQKREQQKREQQEKQEQQESQRKQEVEKPKEENKDQHKETNVPEEGSKIAYLTFDDGPSKNITPQILDILDHYDIKATFFAVGNLAERYPELLKRTYEEGHAIGNHTYSHRYDYIYKKISNLLDELEITEKVFKNILGEDYETNIMRFPGGSFGDKKAPFREAVEAEGYEYVDWNSLNGDAEGYDISEDRLIQRFKSTFKEQENLVILMHDTDAKRTTAQALPEIIDFLIQQGYEFHTLE